MRRCPFCDVVFTPPDPADDEARDGYDIRCPNGHLVGFVQPIPPDRPQNWADLIPQEEP